MCVTFAGLKRSGSVKARKVSTQSLRSDSSDVEPRDMEAADSGGLMSDENPDQSPDESDEHDYSTYMPWIKVSACSLCAFYNLQ